MKDRRGGRKSNSNSRQPNGRGKGGKVVRFPTQALHQQAQPSKPRRRKGHVKKTDGVRHNPEHEPTAASYGMVAVAKSRGWNQQDIADALGISPNTLTKHYRLQLEKGREAADCQVEAAIVRAAVSDDVTTASVKAMTLYANGRLGWGQPAAQQPGSNGAAINVAGDVNVLMQQLEVSLFDEMTDEQRTGAMLLVQSLKAMKEGNGE